MMNYRILLLILIAALAVTACTAVGEAETAVKGMPETAQPAELQPAASATPQAAVVAQTTAPVEPDLGGVEMQTAAPEPTQLPVPTDASVLPVIGPAPGWDNEVWINSDGPLPLEDLRGKVVLLEFWTFG